MRGPRIRPMAHSGDLQFLCISAFLLGVSKIVSSGWRRFPLPDSTAAAFPSRANDGCGKMKFANVSGHLNILQISLQLRRFDALVFNTVYSLAKWCVSLSSNQQLIMLRLFAQNDWICRNPNSQSRKHKFYFVQAIAFDKVWRWMYGGELETTLIVIICLT